MSNDRKLTFKFTVNTSTRPAPKPLVVDFTNSVPQTKFVEMMKEGKMPLPDSWQEMSKGQLSDLGYPKVRWSKRYGVRYVSLNERTKKQYDA